MNKNAFSLVELIVVIAIIAVLAAIAVPSYQRYTIGAKMAEAGRGVQALMHQSIIYAQTHGHFAGDFELGINNDSELLKAVPYYVGGGNYIISDTSTAAAYCGQYGTVEVTLDPVALGFPYSVANFDTGGVYMQCDMWNYQGVVYNSCYYSYGTDYAANDGFNGTGDIVPGWENITNIGGWSATSTAYEATLDSFNNATCM